ncbi:branched-chain amino acid:cation transporter, LIVCS family [Ferrimonas sediminum]|uniref:Branched-chain amino acid transport system carrier protein n=1 Tax=Ferrimonas sediminum TaxID=718193 RepID=A0A1G8T3X7_9GAMM|nr:branched-chain amino acid transport system II carrier protein [Ferrimonas sediminum]SDJ36252.1 branched-chain amino acid:cation transporter, LIVCS family [Ferrimonas sediminum]
MEKRLTVMDTLSVGFMTFAFFLGAGNMIFPPMAGFLAGDNYFPAMLGFLCTAVGLPLLGLIAVAKAGGSIPVITAKLPTWIGATIACAIFIIIGPAFAAPRAGLVAYEMGAVPFLNGDNATTQALYSVIFFGIAMLLALFPGKLVDSVGKVLTPALIVLFAILALAAFALPQDPIVAAQGGYESGAFTKGFLEGYGTMDALASLVFGMLIVDLLRKKGITESAQQAKYLGIAAIIAAIGLSFVYVPLFYLGATSSVLGMGADTGGVILTTFVNQVFGSYGVVMLGAVVTLACLTTVIGLLSACSDYFGELMPKIGYRGFVVINAVFCAVVANVGLSQLITISIPVLMAVYPIAMALIAFCFVRPYLQNERAGLILMVAVSTLFGVIDGVKAAGINTDVLNFLPFYDVGMAWLLPTLVATFVALFAKASPQPAMR